MACHVPKQMDINLAKPIIVVRALIIIIIIMIIIITGMIGIIGITAIVRHERLDFVNM